MCSGVTIFIILRVKNFFRKADVSPWPPWPDILCPAKFIAYNTHSQELFFFLSLWLCPVAYRNLVSQPGIEPMPPAVEAQNFKHGTAGEVPRTFL